jgi:hypothetical protein
VHCRAAAALLVLCSSVAEARMKAGPVVNSAHVHAQTATAGGGGGACCVFVAERYGENISGTVLTTIATASSMNLAAGNLVVAFCRASQTATTITVSDTAGNTYTSITSETYNGPTDRIQAFYAKNTTANAANIVSCNYSPGVQYVAVDALQYSGASTSAPLDQFATGSSDTFGTSNTNPQTVNVTTTVANEVLVAGINIGTGGNFYTQGTGYTLRSTNPSTDASEDDIITTTQTSHATISWVGGSAPWAMILATFK